MMILLVPLLTGCEAMAVASSFVNAGAAYVNNQTAEVYQEIAEQKAAQLEEFIPKECLFGKPVIVDEEYVRVLIQDERGRQFLSDVSKENLKLYENCPNIKKGSN